MTGIENQNNTEKLNKNPDTIPESEEKEVKDVEWEWENITSALNEADISIPETQETDKSEIIQSENNESLESIEYSNEQFEQDKNAIFDVIRRNWGFKTNTENTNNNTGTKEKWNELLKENYMMLAKPDQLKKRIIIQNNIIIKNNFIKKEEKNTININKFMETFTKEQEKIRTKYEKVIIKNEPILVETEAQTQKVWEFIEISENSKNNIKEQLDKIIENWQEITEFTIEWKADATWPKDEQSREVPWKQIALIKENLKDKFDISLLENIETSDWNRININDILDNPEQNKDKRNKWWAYARALMQMSFLDEEHLKIIENSQDFSIKINAQPVWGENKGDEFTGGNLEIDTKGNERTEKKEVTLPLKELNSPILLFHMNINDTKNWVLELVYKNNKLKLEKSRDNTWNVWLDYLDRERKSNIQQDSPANHDYGNLTLNLHLSNEDIWFLDPKNITEEMPLWIKNQNKAKNVKSYMDKSNNFFENLNNQPKDFIKLLNMYKEKTNKPEEVKYIEWIINTIKLLNS